MLKNKFLSFLIFIIITFSASFIGGIVTYTFKEPWYSNLIKPSFNPPDWVFGPVWTILYLFMSIAIWIVWQKNQKNLNLVLIYIIHLFFNTTWSIVFFAFQSILLALINLVALITLIIFLMIKYKPISKLSFYIMFPYLLWCFFALILNTSLLFLN
tara:strand:- start:549 stop:1016 length:468 start_codon:yes stop_codon:yes gene_type:complete